MSKPPKIDRKELKTPDGFVTKGSQVLSVLASRRLHLLPILGIVGVILVGLYAYDWWEDSQSEKAWKAYYEATKVGVTDTREKLQQLCKQWGKTRAGVLASARLADGYFDEAKKDPNQVKSAEEAANWYSKALEYRNLSTVEKQLLYIDRAASFELQKKWDEALGDLKLAADMGGELKGFALLSTGRVYELKADAAKAVENYEKVAADYSSMEYGKMARNHLRRLKSPVLSKAGIS